VVDRQTPVLLRPFVSENKDYMRFTRQRGGEHHVAIPDHADLGVGTPARTLDVATHLGLDRAMLDSAQIAKQRHISASGS